jgi:lipoprotein-anchoring transpeptidase ErfK/SrfK
MSGLRWFAAIILAALIFGAGAAEAASVQISINKISQKMTVTVDGVEKYVWLVSTGASGYSTPSGSYTPFRMESDHYSKEWDDAPMPHSIFFTPGGHAIHGSPHVRSLGTAVSHGCVRLAPDNAATLYALVQKAGMKNTRVTVTGGLDFAFFSRFSAPRISKPKWLQTSWWSSRPSRQPVGRANVAR